MRYELNILIVGKYIALILLSFLPFSSNGQYKEVPVNVPTGGDLFINSISHIGGTSRIVLPIRLPENTVRWYYTVAASRNKADIDRIKAQINLLGQLTKIYDNTGATASALSLITAPVGTDYCDIYFLTSFNEGNTFRDKPLSNFHYYPNNSVKHANTWKQEISEYGLIEGVQYIGIQNTSLSYGVNVNIQVVAIVQVPETKNGWGIQDRQKIHDIVYKMLVDKGALDRTTNDKIEDFLTCFLDNLTQRYTPQEYQSLAQYEKTNVMNEGLKKCKSFIGIN